MDELKKRAKEDDSMDDKLLIDKLPDSFNFYDTSDPSPGLQLLNENRLKLEEYITLVVENDIENWNCETLDKPCIYNLIGKQFCTSNCFLVT